MKLKKHNYDKGTKLNDPDLCRQKEFVFQLALF